MWTGKYVSQTFRRTVMPSSSVSSSPTAFLDCFTLKMKTLHPFETLVTIYQSSWRNIAEGLNLHHNRCEHLIFLALSCFHLEIQLLQIYFSSFVFSLPFSVNHLTLPHTNTVADAVLFKCSYILRLSIRTLFLSQSSVI